MAGAQSGVVKLYLFVYNVILAAGWSYLSYLGIQKRNDYTKIWDHIELPLKVFQTAAVMEVIHAVIGLTKTNFVMVLFQVFSRLLVVWGTLNIAPTAQVSMGVPIMLICWNITEIIRYSYYALNLIGSIGLVKFILNILQWFRYTLFIILYPMGITGELMTMYDSLPYINKHNIWTVRMPNSWNMGFDYYWVLIMFMLSYIPVFPQLYFHMFGQRAKVLGSKQKVQ